MKRVKIPKERIKEKVVKGITYKTYTYYNRGYQKTFYAHDIKSLNEKFNDWLAENDDSVKNTLQECYTVFLKSKKLDVKPLTYVSYESNYRNHIKGSKLGRKSLAEINEFDIKNFLSDLDLNFNSKITLLTHIKSFFKFAELRKWIDFNPATHIKLKNYDVVEEEVNPYVPQEVIDRILEGAKGTPKYVPILLMARCGLRIGESLAITDKDLIHPNKLRINKSVAKIVEDGVTKSVIQSPKNSYSNRTLIIPEDVYEEVKNGTYTKIVDRGGIQAYLRRNGIKAHDLRKTFITEMVQRGVPVDIIRAYVGHSKGSKVLETNYLHLQQDYIDNILTNYYKSSK